PPQSSQLFSFCLPRRNSKLKDALCIFRTIGDCRPRFKRQYSAQAAPIDAREPTNKVVNFVLNVYIFTARAAMARVWFRGICSEGHHRLSHTAPDH
ncbi:MAG: hypothetical protein VX596_01015, partial [Pseudomonadota bacterium]|nr:hypothetical protein [Pseudomonadota bacterium]